MEYVLGDRSFRQNLVGLVIAALMVALINLVPVAHLSRTGAGAMTAQQMTMVEGKGGWGYTLLAVGLTVAVIGVATVMTGGAVIVAAAIANTTFGVAAATTAINVGGYAIMGGGGMAIVGGAVNWVQSQR